MPASTDPAGANLRNMRRRLASPPAVYRSFGRAALAAINTCGPQKLGLRLGVVSFCNYGMITAC